MNVSGYLRVIESKRKGKGYKLAIELPRKADGKRSRIYETVYGTKKQAEYRLRELIHECEQGQRRNAKSSRPITVNQWMMKWLDVYIDDKKSPTTIVGYKSQVKTHI